MESCAPPLVSEMGVIMCPADRRAPKYVLISLLRVVTAKVGPDTPIDAKDADVAMPTMSSPVLTPAVPCRICKETH